MNAHSQVITRQKPAGESPVRPSLGRGHYRPKGEVASAVLPHHLTYGSRIRRFLPAIVGVKFMFQEKSTR